jgi:heat shock protein HslJ
MCSRHGTKSSPTSACRPLRVGIALSIVALSLAACEATQPGAAPQSNDTMLKGSWSLLELQSSSDGSGDVRPDDPAKYELTLAGDGRASLQLDCNGATGVWTSSAADQTHGSITFTPLAMSRSACALGSLDTRIVQALAGVRTYSLGDGRLVLKLAGNSGDQVWMRIAE